MTIQNLYDNLLTYELELNQKVELTTNEHKKKDKGIDLEAIEVSSKTHMEDDNDFDDDEDLSFLSKRLRKRQDKGSSFRKGGYQQKRDSSKDLCYNCKKPDHYIGDCIKSLKDELNKDKKKDYPKTDKKSYKKH